MAQDNLGYIHEEQKRYREAFQYFDDARKHQSGIAAASGMLNGARCLENLGETDRACQYYKEFIEKFPSSTFIAFARAKVSALCNS
jgi:TolA-binding protein